MSRTYKDNRAARFSRKEQDELKNVKPYKRTSNHRLKETVKKWRVS